MRRFHVFFTFQALECQLGRSTKSRDMISLEGWKSHKVSVKESSNRSTGNAVADNTAFGQPPHIAQGSFYFLDGDGPVFNAMAQLAGGGLF